jgi:hypothetical protein
MPIVVLCLITASCSEEAGPPPDQRGDPAVAQALDDPLMTDPDLSARNEGASAITVQTDGALPVLPASPEAIAEARAEAAALVGGERLSPLPAPTAKVPALPDGHKPADHLAVLRGKTACRAKLADSAIWAARLPAALPIYPHGATQAATGGAGMGCRVIAVAFTTPIRPSEVLAFYWHRARMGRLAPVHASAGVTQVLQGEGEGTAFDLRVRQDGEETLVELATATG